jgi:hypothetical protein
VHLIFFSAAGWEAWGLDRRPLIRQSMPVLIDGDLRFEDEHGLRPTVAVNQWLQELPVSGAPAPNTWEVYARVLKGWLQFLADRGLVVFGPREQLRSGLALYAEHRWPDRWRRVWPSPLGICMWGCWLSSLRGR